MGTMLEQKLNGIDTDALRATVAQVSADPALGMTSWKVATTWQGGTVSESRVEGFKLGGREVRRQFTMRTDEPLELCGTNRHANPQEYLLAALNACMTVGYVAGCALNGIELESLRIETEGDIDLRGFLGLDPAVKPGYDKLRYTITVKGKGTPEQFRRIHENVMATSPNYFNLAKPVGLESRLVVE